MTSRRWSYHAVEIAAPVMLVAFLWWFTENNANYAVATLPDIADEFRKAWLFDRFESDILPSLRRLSLGFGISVLIGVPLGLALGWSRALRFFLQPVLTFFRSIPPIALLPAMLILLGIGDSMKVSLIALVCVWPIVLNTADAVAELDPTMDATTKVFGLTASERLFRVVIPSAGPRIFAGMRTSLSFAILLLVGSEYVASSSGIGFFIVQSQHGFGTAPMWAGIALLGILGCLLNAGFSAVERRVLRWNMNTLGGGS